MHLPVKAVVTWYREMPPLPSIMDKLGFITHYDDEAWSVFFFSQVDRTWEYVRISFLTDAAPWESLTPGAKVMCFEGPVLAAVATVVDEWPYETENQKKISEARTA